MIAPAALSAQTPHTLAAAAEARLDTDMAYLLDMHRKLGARPMEHCSVTEARRQPTLYDAIEALRDRQGERRRPDEPIEVQLQEVPGPDGAIPLRIHRSQLLAGKPVNLPVIVYLHGGHFVLEDNARADRIAHDLARRTGALVIMPQYRLAPEHAFPAPLEDIAAVWQWLGGNLRGLGGDPRRIALVGEDAGAFLAVNTALSARDGAGLKVLHQVLIDPLARLRLDLPLRTGALRALPVNSLTLRWCLRHALAGAQAGDPRLDLVARPDLSGLPPTTLVLAEADPLMAETEDFIDALGKAGTSIDMQVFSGVPRSFFGLGRLVNKALFAEQRVAMVLRAAFGRFSRRP